MSGKDAATVIADLLKQMNEITVLHKVEMKRLSESIRTVQEMCPHTGEWWERCPWCGKAKEEK